MEADGQGPWETYMILDNGAGSLEARVHRKSKTVVVMNGAGSRDRAEVFRARYRQLWIGQNWSRFRGPWGVPGHCCPVHGEDVAGQCVLLRAEDDEPDTGKAVYFWILWAQINRFTTDADDRVVQMESTVGSNAVTYPFITTAKAALLLPYADRHHPDSLVRVPHAVLFEFACREMADSGQEDKAEGGHNCMLSPADTFFEIKAADLDAVVTYHPMSTVYEQ
jgi:hypothetical protein